MSENWGGHEPKAAAWRPHKAKAMCFTTLEAIGKALSCRPEAIQEYAEDGE